MQLRDPTVVPLERSKNHVFHATGLYAWPRQPGFLHDRCSSSSFSNTSIYPSDFYKDCKSHILIEIENRYLNPLVCNLILLNSQTSQTATFPSHFTNTRSCIAPTSFHQTENLQYFNTYAKSSHCNHNHTTSKSTLPNSLTTQNIGSTQYFLSIIISSIIFHHHVKSQDLHPCHSVDITGFIKFVFIHSETNTVYPYLTCPSQFPENLIISSIISHHLVKSQVFNPWNSVYLTNFTQLVFAHTETTTLQQYSICPYHLSGNPTSFTASQFPPLLRSQARLDVCLSIGDSDPNKISIRGFGKPCKTKCWRTGRHESVSYITFTCSTSLPLAAPPILHDSFCPQTMHTCFITPLAISLPLHHPLMRSRCPMNANSSILLRQCAHQPFLPTEPPTGPSTGTPTSPPTGNPITVPTSHVVPLSALSTAWVQLLTSLIMISAVLAIVYSFLPWRRSLPSPRRRPCHVVDVSSTISSHRPPLPLRSAHDNCQLYQDAYEHFFTEQCQGTYTEMNRSSQAPPTALKTYIRSPRQRHSWYDTDHGSAVLDWCHRRHCITHPQRCKPHGSVTPTSLRLARDRSNILKYYLF